MADTTTTAYGLTKPEIGASEDTWGTKINTDLDTLDTVVNAIGGKTAAATLSYADAAKIATTATGVDVTGTVTATGTSVFASLDISGDIDVDGTTNLDVVDIDGAVNMATTALVTGVLTTTAATVHTGGITMPDSAKAIFGAGSDLQIYHDGSHSYIKDAGDGQLRLLAGTNVQIWNSDATNLAANFNGDTQTAIYYAGDQKLTTTASGIDVTGGITADGLTVSPSGTQQVLATLRANSGSGGGLVVQTDASDDGLIRGYDASGDVQLQFDTDGGDNYIAQGNVGIGNSSPTTALDVTGIASADQLNSKNGKLFLDDNGSHNGVINAPASLFINFDSDNTSASESVVFGYDRDGTSGGTSVVTINSTGLDVVGQVTATGGAASAPTYSFIGDTDTGISRPTTNAVNIVTAGTERMRIDSSGNVGIGTTAPTAPITILSTGWEHLNLKSSDVNATNKTGYVTVGHYTNAQESFGLISGQSTTSSNILNLGGGAAGLNAATSINLYTASNNTTVTGTPRVSIDASGNVGIGTSSITRELELWNSDSTTYGSTTRADAGTNQRIFNTSNTNSVYAGLTLAANNGGSTTSEFTIANVSTSSNYLGELVFQAKTGVSSYAERMRIDSSGNVGIGFTSPSTRLFVSGGVNSAHATFSGQASRGLVISTANTLSNDDGVIYNAQTAGSGKHIFQIAGTEAMRIDASGNLFVGGVASESGLSKAFIEYSSQSQYGLELHDDSIGTTATQIAFYKQTAIKGSITTTSSATSYNTSSDHRLKENVTYDWDATTRLKQLKPARFNFIVDADTTVDGFLAHEAQAVVPEAVTGTHNEVDDDGNAVMQGIDQSKIVPLLVKTILELEARITALEG